MMNLNQDNLTQAVVESFSGTSDERLKEIMISLVQHLHTFAREVKLTEEEWFKGIDFLTRCGHITDDKRQEFILLSDVLGLSMLTVALNNDKPVECTEATVFGPFHVDGAPEFELGSNISNGAKGVPCKVRGSVRGLSGELIPNALIDVWQSDEDGLYDVQKPELKDAQARGVVYTDKDGRYEFDSILAVPYAIPHDGPVGDLLGATGRHPWRPAHLHFLIKADGYETLITHLFRKDSEYIDSDAVFAVRSSLIVDWVEQPDGSYLLEYDFVLNPRSK
jgi:hydroxyquinol 1,2-dioxygenase